MISDLIGRVHDAVLRQEEEAVTDYFTVVDELREFLTARVPSPGVELTVKMVCFGTERLTAGNGTRVTLIDYLAHGAFENLSMDLANLNSINRKPFIAQVTVWDAKTRVGSPRSVSMQFRPGAVYQLKQVHNVGFYAEIPKGSVQLEEGVTDRVVQTAAPILKRKAEHEPSVRKGKVRALNLQDTEEEKEETAAVGGATVAPRSGNYSGVGVSIM